MERDSITVGFVGLGNLGFPMAIAAANEGFRVTVFDVRPERVRLCVQQGGITAGQLKDVAACDLVAIAVQDDGQVREVIDKIVSSMRAGSVIVVHSTVLPETVQDLAGTVAEFGVGLLDVPVSGGEVAAAAGELTLMVGGDEEWIVVASPYFDAVGRSIYILGPLGTGSAGKLANQLMMFMTHLGALEAMKLAEAYGVSEEQVCALSRHATSDSWILRNWGFFDRVQAEYDAAETPHSLRPWSKDLWDILVVARSAGLSLPFAAQAAHLALPMFEDRAS